MISGANMREGVAYNPDGALYVAVAPGGTISNPTITGTATLGDGTQSTQTLAANVSGTDTSFEFGSASVQYDAGSGKRFFIGNTAVALGSGMQFGWGGAAAPAGNDATLARAGANSIIFGPGTTGAGAATTRTEGNKAVAAIANAVATDVLTVTIPNAAHSASLKVKVIGSLGAGGAIGANEASATNTYDVIITRTAGVATVVAISSAYGAAASAVAGAATVTAVATVTAMTGAVGATQTFTVQVTISRSGGSSTNHTCVVIYELGNANATGITLA